MKYDTVIFDLDGTLLDTLDDLTAAVCHSLAENGYPSRTREEVRTFVGNGIGRLMSRALPKDARVDEDTEHRVLDSFVRYYAAHNNDATRPYPGIPEMMKTLDEHGVRMAIVSNKNDPNVKSLNEQYFGLPLAVGEQPGIRRKPYPDSVKHVMDVWKCDPEHTLYVGDSEVDVETARNAGIPCAAVLWGFRTHEQLAAAGAECMIGTPEELVRLILE